MFNLVFKNGAGRLREVAEIEVFINEISAFIRGSPNREDTLRRQLEALKCPVRLPLRNMPVRWCSSYEPSRNLMSSFEGIVRTLEKYRERSRECKEWLKSEMDHKISRANIASNTRVILGPMPKIIERVRKMYTTPCVGTLAVVTDAGAMMIEIQSMLSARNMSLMDLPGIINCIRGKVSVFLFF